MRKILRGCSSREVAMEQHMSHANGERDWKNSLRNTEKKETSDRPPFSTSRSSQRSAWPEGSPPPSAPKKKYVRPHLPNTVPTKEGVEHLEPDEVFELLKTEASPPQTNTESNVSIASSAKDVFGAALSALLRKRLPSCRRSSNSSRASNGDSSSVVVSPRRVQASPRDSTASTTPRSEKSTSTKLPTTITTRPTSSSKIVGADETAKRRTSQTKVVEEASEVLGEGVTAESRIGVVEVPVEGSSAAEKDFWRDFPGAANCPDAVHGLQVDEYSRPPLAEISNRIARPLEEAEKRQPLDVIVEEEVADEAPSSPSATQRPTQSVVPQAQQRVRSQPSAPSSPTEMPVPTEMPSPTSPAPMEAELDLIHQGPAPPVRQPTSMARAEADDEDVVPGLPARSSSAIEGQQEPSSPAMEPPVADADEVDLVTPATPVGGLQQEAESPPTELPEVRPMVPPLQQPGQPAPSSPTELPAVRPVVPPPQTLVPTEVPSERRVPTDTQTRLRPIAPGLTGVGLPTGMTAAQPPSSPTELPQLYDPTSPAGDEEEAMEDDSIPVPTEVMRQPSTQAEGPEEFDIDREGPKFFDMSSGDSTYFDSARIQAMLQRVWTSHKDVVLLATVCVRSDAVRCLLSASADGGVRVFELSKTGAQPQNKQKLHLQPPAAKGHGVCTAFAYQGRLDDSPDQASNLNVIYGAYESGHLAGWNAMNGQLLVDLPGHTGCVNAMECYNSTAVLDTGQPFIISASCDGSIRVWRGVEEAAAATAALAAGLSLEEAGLERGLAEPPKMVIDQIRKTLERMYEPLKQNMVPDGPPKDIAVSGVLSCAKQFGADRPLLVSVESALTKKLPERTSVDYEAMVQLEDEQGACCLFVLEFGQRNPVADFRLLGSQLFAASWDGKLGCLDLKRRTCNNEVEIRHQTRIMSLAVQPKSDHASTTAFQDHVVFFGIEDGSVIGWNISAAANASSSEICCWKGHQAAVTQLAFVSATSSSKEDVIPLEFRKDGPWRIYDDIHPETARYTTVSHPPLPDKWWLVSASEDRIICIWSPEDGTLIKEYFGHLGGIVTMCCAEKDRLLWTGSRDFSLRSWSLDDAYTMVTEKSLMAKADKESQNYEIAVAKANKANKASSKKKKGGKSQSSSPKPKRGKSPGAPKSPDSPKTGSITGDYRLDGHVHSLQTLYGQKYIGFGGHLLADIPSGGLHVPHNTKNFPGYKPAEEKGAEAEYDAEAHKDRILGNHVKEYMEMIQEEDPTKYEAHFAKFIADGIDADGMEEMYTNAHAKIKEDPEFKPTEKKEITWERAGNDVTSSDKTTINRSVKLSLKQRREKVLVNAVPEKMLLQGAQLFVPLPPGCWLAETTQVLQMARENPGIVWDCAKKDPHSSKAVQGAMKIAAENGWWQDINTLVGEFSGHVKQAYESAHANYCLTVMFEVIPTYFLGCVAQDGVAVARELLTPGFNMRYLRLRVMINSTSIPRLPDPLSKKGDKESSVQNGASLRTFLVLHILGRCFQTDYVVDETPKYAGTFQIDIPISATQPLRDCLRGLDLCTIGLEVIKCEDYTTLWAGTTPLWKIFASDRPSPTVDGKELVTSLSETLGQNGSGHALKNCYLAHPTVEELSQINFGTVELDVTAQQYTQTTSTVQCISPELQGCGLSTALYSTHRGALLNPKITSSIFNTTNVANFVELKLESLSFPANDKDDPNSLSRYFVEAKCNGVRICSTPLYRARAAWSSVLVNAVPEKMLLQGAQLFVPLPPGCWLAETTQVEIAVVKQPVFPLQPMSFQALKSADRQNRQPDMSGSPVYHAILILDVESGWGIDQPKHMSLKFGSVASRQAPVQTKVIGGEMSGASGDGAKLIVDVSLRDRDYVRMSSADYRLSQRALFVGDAAMLMAEEPLQYPQTQQEFHKRMVPGEFDRNKAKASQTWNATLRDPCLSHEYSLSGLSDIPTEKFKQRNIPGHFTDLIPYRYVFSSSSSEQEFIEKGRPGVFWRIMDDLAKSPPKTQSTVGSKPVRIVENLTHVLKSIPVVVLAVYSNQTCDLELAASFVQEWMKNSPGKQYCLPGNVSIFPGKAPEATKGGKEAEPPPPKVFLKAVPLSFMTAVHAASFNVYDARFNTSEDSIKVPTQKNDHNPRDSDSQGDRRGAYNVQAGPLPADALGNCQYEWSLHLHARSAEDMYHFVTMIRQCVRIDHYQQVSRLKEAKSRNTYNIAAQYNMGPARTTAGGYLEVVLVEARRLVKTRVQKHKDMTDAIRYETGLMQSTPSTVVQFVVSKEATPHSYPEDYELEPGESIQVATKGWDMTKTNYAVLLRTSAGETAFRVSVIWKDGKITLSGPDAEKKNKDEPVKDAFPEVLKPIHGKTHDLVFRFLLTDAKWEVSINKKRCPSLDFEHFKVPLSDKVVKATCEGLQQPKVFLIRDRELLSVKGSKLQQSPVVGPTVSPNWAKQEGLQGTGGWVFKTPEIDPSLNPQLEFKMTLFNQNSLTGFLAEMGQVHQHITGGFSEGGSPMINLCEPTRPFNNLWLPLAEKDPKTGHLKPKLSGEIHIMTRWVPNVPPSNKPLPKTCRAYLMNELRPKLQSAQLRLPIYDIQERLHGYNPNLSAQMEYPPARAETMAVHAEQLYNNVPYLECCEGREIQMWKDFEANVLTTSDEKKMLLADVRKSWLAQIADQKIQDKVYTIDEHFRRGIPPTWRLSRKISMWSEITYATAVVEQIAGKNKDQPELAYLALLEFGRPLKSEAMLQLQEDVVTAASWESSKYPEIMDRHLQRVRRAQNVCIALITLSANKGANKPVEIDVEQIDQQGPQGKAPNAPKSTHLTITVPVPELPKDQQPPARGVAYCESLLIIAFAMLLPQVDNSERKAKGSSFGAAGEAPDPNKNYLRESFLDFTTKSDSQKRPDSIKYNLAECQEESRVFWLLYTLIGASQNQEYADYFGTLKPEQRTRKNVIADINIRVADAIQSPLMQNVLVDHTGATRDVHLLSCILSRNMSELWVHLNSIGFQLSSVFYGAFMRWFVFYLPLSSVFRFWDLLFAESTRLTFSDPPKEYGLRLSTTKRPARHVLIDLAYAVLKACSPKLMTLMTALEARDCLVNYMEGLYDPSTIIEIVADAERDLWETLLQEYLQRPPDFLNDFSQTEEWYQKSYVMTWVQNQVLLELKDEMRIDPDRSRGQMNNMMSNAMSNAAQQKHTDQRMTTKNLQTHILQPLRRGQEALGPSPEFGGLWRPLPKHIYEAGPTLDKSLGGRVMRFFGQAAESALHVYSEDMMRIKPVKMPALPGILPEPATFDKNTFMKLIQTSQLHDLQRFTGNLYDAFMDSASADASRMSITEMLIAIICCSKGTIGERILCLFRIYATNENQWNMGHHIPVLHHSKAVVDKVEGSSEREKKKVYQPPEDHEVPKTTALKFTVMFHEWVGHHKQEKMLGEVFVPSLHPYVLAGMVRPQPESFTIWAPRIQGAAARQFGRAPTSAGNDSSQKLRRSIGELNMGISFVPHEKDRSSVGQLCVSVHHIKFDTTSGIVDLPNKKNPFIRVTTFDERNQEVTIPRWDPRTGTRKVINTMTLGMKYGGAFKGHLEWDETMHNTGVGHMLISADHTVKGHGWDDGDQAWKWAHKWGEQYSIEDFTFARRFTETESGPNTISIQACRLITLAILRRTLVYITNRQAMLMADAVFNRAGVVPGIMDAIIVQGSRVPEGYTTGKQLMDDYKARKMTFLDVKHNLLIEHERQVNQNLGELDMWLDANTVPAMLSLKEDLKIEDPFPGVPKVLWIRYTRAGDGERQQIQLPVEADGKFRKTRIELDMKPSGSARKAQAQMNISKEEFLSCFQEHPLLSESLRQICSRDQEIRPEMAGNQVKLDVTITDPTRHYEDDDMFDMQNVRQKILLEVWDHDRAGFDDFLGECWLPSLGQKILENKRVHVLQVGNADTSSKNSTRTDKRKHQKEHVKATGELYIEASWVIPHEKDKLKEPGENETLQERVKREEIMHTGRLTIKVIKATGLRATDSSHFTLHSTKAADPYVIAYIYNEASETWKKNHTTKLDEQLFRTKTIRHNINPEWNEEFKPFIIKTGAYEKKTKHQWHLQITNRQKQEAEDQRMLQTLEQDELRVYFGDEEREKNGLPGSRHKVQIYLGDTVRQFKTKLLIACHKEALAEKDPVKAAKYQAVKVGIQTVVTVFVPSEKLRSLFSQSREDAREYKRLYKLEEQDPSFWQPLDPIRSFGNYASTYGFGHQTGNSQKDPAQRLRIAEATAEYKMRNQRYKHFEEEINSCTNRLDDTDTDKLCFGYGKYIHENDNQTGEWRPCLVSRPDSSSDTVKRTFTVEWMYAFGGADPNEMTKQAELDEDSVLLAPRIPHILGSGTLEHQQFLEQAVDMKASGLSETDIAVELNKKLDAKFEMAKEAVAPNAQKGDLMKPARITESEVKHFLKKREGEEGNSSSSMGAPVAASNSGIPSMLPTSPSSMSFGDASSFAGRLQGGMQSMHGSMQGIMSSVTNRSSADNAGGGVFMDNSVGGVMSSATTRSNVPVQSSSRFEAGLGGQGMRG